MNKKEFNIYLHERVNYWWSKLGLTAASTKYTLNELEEGFSADTHVDPRYGRVHFRFDRDKLIKQSKNDIDTTICHECTHVLLSEMKRVFCRTLDTYVKNNQAKDVLSDLFIDEEEAVCELLSNRLTKRR